jgi:hypothetical protein
MAKSKPKDIVEELQYLSDEDARALERTVIVETTGDHALDPAEEVADDADS